MHVVDGLVLLSVEDDGRGFVETRSRRAPTERASRECASASVRLVVTS